MINCHANKKARYDAWEEDIAALNIFFGKETVKGHFRLLQNQHKIFPHLKSKDLSGIDFYLDSITIVINRKCAQRWREGHGWPGLTSSPHLAESLVSVLDSASSLSLRFGSSSCSRLTSSQSITVFSICDIQNYKNYLFNLNCLCILVNFSLVMIPQQVIYWAVVKTSRNSLWTFVKSEYTLLAQT